MNTFGFYNEVSSPYFGVIIAIILMLPSILLVTIFKPKFKVKDNKKEITKLERIFGIIENISRIGVLIILCASKNSFDIVKADLWFGIMLFFFILYYELFIRYVVNGRAHKLLYAPFMYVRVPMAILPAFGIIFAGIWGRNIVLIIFSIIFAITHIYNAYKYYIRNFVEYRDLYDNNRKAVGKKILSDSCVPKNLNYVTVVVFIYSKKTGKWLMQKRSKDKGGKWATTSGHPISGQTSIDGMVTEIKEELGLNVRKEELELITTMKRKDKFVDIYYLEKDVNIEKLYIQKEELTEVNWMTKNDVEAFYSAQKYKKTHYKYFKEILQHINKNV
ncbi:MAG: NUDIX domain-containing protein [Clostridia bacterium]|nr:NUDIX domain-containing protein [Clostridia bacterium]